MAKAQTKILNRYDGIDMRAIYAQLTEKQQEALYLLYGKGMSIGAAARQIGVQRQAVQQRHGWATKRINKLVKKERQRMRRCAMAGLVKPS